MEQLAKSTTAADSVTGIGAKTGIWVNDSVFGKGVNTIYQSKHYLIATVLADDPGVSGQTLITALASFIVPLMQGDSTALGERFHYYQSITPPMLKISPQKLV